MEDFKDSGAAIISLTDEAIADASEEAPWRTLAEGKGILVSWERAESFSAGKQWGSRLSGSSALAKQLIAVTERAGAGGTASAGEMMFRLELPAGQTMQNLVPAVGGGLRGITRASETGRIAGHVKLHSVGGRAVGTGKTLALGPLMGLMAFSIGMEMLAKQQQDAKLMQSFLP